jgi:hypothetical protein
MRLPISTPILLLPLLAACQAEPDVEMIRDLPNLTGGNPIVPDVGLLPFPSTLYEASSQTSRTGRLLDFSEASLPAGIEAPTFETMDGFSRLPQIVTQVEGGLDPASLPDAADPEATMLSSSPILLINTETQETTPIIAEIDRSFDSNHTPTLLIRPLRTLAPSTLYGVVLTTDLRTEAGQAITANEAVRALRDGIPTDSSELEHQREDFDTLLVAASALGVDTAQVASGWTFHTRSKGQLNDPLLAMHDRMMAFDLNSFQITSEEDNGKNTLIRGEFLAPNFLNADQRITLDADGLPIEQAEKAVPFLVTIPHSVVTARPAMVYGHGFFSHMDEPSWSSLNNSLQTWNMSAVSTNFIGFTEDDLLQAVQGLGGDLTVLGAIVDQQLQAQANFTALGRLTRSLLAEQILDDDGEPLLAVDTLNYMGISNGGTQGAVINTFSPVFDQATLIVGGGGWAHMMQRATQWNTMGAVLQSRYPDPTELQLAISLLQQVLDPVDSVNYVENLVHDRQPGREQALRVTLHEAVGDCQVSNLTTEWLARTAGIPLLTPTPRAVWGLETLDGAASETATSTAALFMYDEGYAPLPEGNVAPSDDNGAHETIRDLDSYHQQVGAFLESGLIHQVCDGPCDPN